MIYTKALACAMGVLALSGCSGSDKASFLDRAFYESLDRAFYESVKSEAAKSGAAAEKSADALEMAQNELEIAEKYAAKLNAKTVKGSSMMARANAQKVLDARDAVNMARAAAMLALTMAENAKTALDKLETEAMTAGDARGLEAVRISLAQAEQDVMDAQEDVMAAAAIDEGTALKMAVAEVTGADAEEHGDAVATVVENNLSTSVTFLSLPVMAEAVVTGDSHPGMTFEEIAMAQGDLFSEQIFNKKLSPAVSLDGASSTVPGAYIYATDSDGVDFTWKGIKGRAYCRLVGCGTSGTNISDSKFFGGWYFTAAPVDGEATMYYLKVGDYYTAELYAKYGSWFNTANTFSKFAGLADPNVTHYIPTHANGALEGSATYVGTAGGLSVHREFDTQGVATSVESGVFTADISLTATFGMVPKLNGEVTNFGGDAVDDDWKIKLAEQDFDLPTFSVTNGEIKGDGELNTAENGGWNAIPYGASATAAPDGFFGGFNANFSNGGVSGSYAASKK